MSEPIICGLDTAEWRRVEQIFHRVAEHPAEEWQRRVSEQCDGDQRLAREVLALLGCSEHAGDRLDQSIRSTVEDWLQTESPEAAGEPREIGPFRVLERLGEGGLAIVYLAAREKPYRQRVAIKLLKRGMDTEDILRRLKLEGQILAELEHPNIARLLDGGWTEDGRPYFVLEYVAGEPIDVYCDRRELGVRERLRLFYRSSLAVQQAHNRLIIHRDLKPSNLLVTTEGEPKLLDFGIAKLLDASGLGVTTAHTRPGVHWMTPDYAAPEQVVGGSLTTAVDVYALGVMLYQLLCGRLPRRLAGKRPSEIERLFEKKIEPPSSRVDDRAARLRGCGRERLAKTLQGDLDTIVMMALQAEPERRYASVQQLAEDIDRFLRSQPVLARADTWSYRGAKFVRRNRAGVAAVSAVFLSLLLGVITSTHSLRIADTQRRLAEQRLGEVEAVIELTTGMFEIADPGESRGSTVTAREILDHGAARIHSEMAGQPAIAARLMDTMGQVYRNLGLYSSARDLLGAASGRWQEAAGGDSAESVASQRLLAAVLIDEGHFEQAREVLQAVRAAELALLEAPHPELATTLHLVGLVTRQLEGIDAAEDPLRQSLAMRLELYGEGHEAVAESRNDLGELLHDRGELEAAERQYRQALEVRLELFGPEHPQVAETLHDLATTLRYRGALAESQAELEKVVRIRRSLLGDVHRDVAVSLNNLAQVHHEQGQHEQALTTSREALEIARRSVPGHPMTSQIMNNVALELRDLGRLEEAVEVMAQSLAARQELYGEHSEHVVLPQFNFALLLSQSGRRQEAIALLTKTLENMEILGIVDHRMAYPLTLLADLWAQEGRCDRSAGLAARAVELRGDLPPEDALRKRSEEVAALCTIRADLPSAR